MTWRCTDSCCRPEDIGDIYIALSRRHVQRTRKEHLCTYCGKQIATGSAADVTVILGEGKCFSDYRHSSCEEG